MIFLFDVQLRNKYDDDDDDISLHCALGLAAQCIVIGSGVIKTFLSKTKTSISRPIPRPCMAKPSVQDQTLRLKIKTGTKTKTFL